jgi:RNA polymerase-binding transcription factor DksA
MAAAQVVEPVKIGAAMAEQTFANGPRIDVRTNARGGVVVEFEEDRSEIVNQPVDGASDVLACGGRAEVKQVPARIADAHTVALEERELAELNQIAAALARITDGSYGECTACGADVGVARLQANPVAERCIACQTKLEQAQGQPHIPSM